MGDILRLPGDPSLPPGVTLRMIDDAAGGDCEAAFCSVCGQELDETPNGTCVDSNGDEMEACHLHQEWYQAEESGALEWWPPDPVSAYRARCLCKHGVIHPWSRTAEECECREVWVREVLAPDGMEWVPVWDSKIALSPDEVAMRSRGPRTHYRYSLYTRRIKREPRRIEPPRQFVRLQKRVVHD